MAETRDFAQAINPNYGNPEIIISRDQWSDCASGWLPGNLIERIPWPRHDIAEPHDDADDLLEAKGWRVDGGWHTTDFGAITVVEPTG
jgi:hypothetical protein